MCILTGNKTILYVSCFPARLEKEKQASDAAKSKAEKADDSKHTKVANGSAVISNVDRENKTKLSPHSSARQATTRPDTSTSQAATHFGSINGILTPLPAQSSATQLVTASVAARPFNPEDFENSAQDPFEAVELKTLDDMVELNKVLSGVQVTSHLPNSTTVNNAHYVHQSSASTHAQGATHPVTSSHQSHYFPGMPPTHPSTVSTHSRAPLYYPGLMTPSTDFKDLSQFVEDNDQKIIQRSFPMLLPNKSNPKVTPLLKDIGYPDINLGSAYHGSLTSANTPSVSTSNVQGSYQNANPVTATVAYTNPWATTSGYSAPYAHTASTASKSNLSVHDQSATSLSQQTIQHNNSQAAHPHSNYTPSAQASSSTYHPATTTTTAAQTHAANTSSHNPHQVARTAQAPYGGGGGRVQEFYQKASPEAVSTSSAASGSRSHNHSRTATPEPTDSGMRGAKSTSDLVSMDASESEFIFTPRCRDSSKVGSSFTHWYACFYNSGRVSNVVVTVSRQQIKAGRRLQ